MKEGREIFKLSGEPESSEEIRRDRDMLPSRSGGLEKSPELEDFLRRVDFALWYDIFKRIAEKSGINPETLNLLNPDRIFNKHIIEEGQIKKAKDNEPTGNLGGYEATRNIIFFYIKEMEKNQQTDFLGIHPDLLKLHALCHEETHATAKTICRGVFARSRHTKVQMGYQQSEFKKTILGDRLKRFFEFFNEGVTEKLAREVLSDPPRL